MGKVRTVAEPGAYDTPASNLRFSMCMPDLPCFGTARDPNQRRSAVGKINSAALVTSDLPIAHSTASRAADLTDGFMESGLG